MNDSEIWLLFRVYGATINNRQGQKLSVNTTHFLQSYNWTLSLSLCDVQFSALLVGGLLPLQSYPWFGV